MLDELLSLRRLNQQVIHKFEIRETKKMLI